MLIIETDIARSRYQHISELINVSAYGALLTYCLGDIWPILLFILFYFWLIYHHKRAYFQFERLKLSDSSIQLYSKNTSNEVQQFHWNGQGMRTPVCITWKLRHTNNQHLWLYIWKDSVSDASWRALNMAFRVLSQQARQKDSQP